MPHASRTSRTRATDQSSSRSARGASAGGGGGWSQGEEAATRGQGHRQVIAVVATNDVAAGRAIVERKRREMRQLHTHVENDVCLDAAVGDELR